MKAIETERERWERRKKAGEKEEGEREGEGR